MQKLLLSLMAIAGGLGVALGAFGSHYLKQKLSTDMLVVFESGVRYQMYHVFALFVSIWSLIHYQDSIFAYSAWAFLAGIVLFSGSLYILSISGIRSWGMITPIGGVFFLVGWSMLFWGFFKAS